VLISERAGQAGAACETLPTLLANINGCRLCIDAPIGCPLPHEPRPVLRAHANARIVICGQAPGTRAHASGIPFTDPSGDRLRGWMGVTLDEFYDADRIAIVPMGFCFPGLDTKGGDRPPRPECMATWHTRVFAQMPNLDLFLMVGMAALRWHARDRIQPRLTETVETWRDFCTRDDTRTHTNVEAFPLPHPSWRNNAWIKARPWFETDLLPELRMRVRERL
jgi:uracil-DNA glycosylase